MLLRILGLCLLTLLLVTAPCLGEDAPANSADAVLAKARMLRDSGKGAEGAAVLKEAIAALKGIKTKEPENAENLFDLAQLLVELQSDDEAMANIKEAIRLSPKEAKFYALQGQLFAYANKDNEAIKAFKKATELETKNPQYAATWATLAMSAGKYDQAVEGFKRVSELDPQSVDAYLGIANCYGQLSKYEEARPYWTKALEIDPKNPLAHAIAAELLQKSGKLVDAITYYKIALQIEPENSGALAGLVQVYQSQEKTAERDEVIQKLYALHKQKKLKSPYFCRDRFSVGKEFVEVFELYELEGQMPMVYRFHIADGEGKEVKYVISLGSYDFTNQINKELGLIKEGERSYHLDRYRRIPGGTQHETFGMFNEKPSYEETKKMVEGIISGKVKPLIGSTKVDEPEKGASVPKDKKE